MRRLSRLRRKPSLPLRLLTERNKLHTTKQDNEQYASYAKENVAKVEAELQKIYDGILALMDKNLTPSVRRIAEAEGHQQMTPNRSSSFSKSILNRDRREATRKRCSQERHESCDAEWCIQEHTAQREVVAVEEQQKLAKKSLEIQVEEKQVAEIKNKVQKVKKSPKVTNSSIKQTQMTSVNGYRGDGCQNHAHAEKTKSSESKRTSRLVRGPGEERNTETRMRRTRRRSKLFLDSEKQCFTVRNILTKEKLKDKSPRRLVHVEAHHEEVQGRELRGQGNFGVEHRSHRGCRGLVQLSGSTRTSRSSRSTALQISSRNIGNAVARKEIWTSNPGWYEW